MVNGRINGEIEVTETLLVGAKAVVNAAVQAGALIVRGELTGSVVATDRFELKAGARVFGDVEARVILEEGAVFEGRCRTSNVKAAGSQSADGTVAAFNR
jgi:cytoskeletal protein CcmA (bactofilin family)